MQCACVPLLASLLPFFTVMVQIEIKSRMRVDLRGKVGKGNLAACSMELLAIPAACRPCSMLIKGNTGG